MPLHKYKFMLYYSYDWFGCHKPKKNELYRYRKKDYMITHVEHFHGSDLEKIESIYGIKKENIISFSANVNPLGVSPKLREGLSSRIDAITSYPDREYTLLRKSISTYVDTDYNNIIVGNGSTELISLFIQIKKPQNALIFAPTYSEYEREVKLGGGNTLYYELKEKHDFIFNFDDFISSLQDSVDLLIICNPNNPTSTALYNKDIKAILDLCKQRGIYVCIDETYVEFAKELNKITAIPLTKEYDNLIVLRGISKFFAAPGLRLGYAICSNIDFINEINLRKNPWTINSLAAIAGEIMFSDEDYIRNTKLLINSERERICNILSESKHLKLYEPVANFVLVKILKESVHSMDIFEASIKKSLMIRDCSSFNYLNDKFLRFCFMDPKDNDRLLSVILDCLS